MARRVRKRQSIDFLPETSYYRRLNILIYLISVICIVLVYFIVVFLFSDFPANFLITALFSFVIGLTLVLKRHEITKYLSSRIEERKRRQYKQRNHENLRRTIKTIVPRQNNLRLNIKQKTGFKDKVKHIKGKITDKSKKEKQGYIEYKD